MGIDVCIGGENQNEVILVDVAAMEWANARALMKTHPRSTFPAPSPSPYHRTGRRAQHRPVVDDSAWPARGLPLCAAIADVPGIRRSRLRPSTLPLTLGAFRQAVEAVAPALDGP